MCGRCQSVPNANLHQTLFFCMGCWSAPKVNTFKTSECAQCECASVPAYFSWSFLHPNCQNTPNVNLLVLLHYLAGHFCTQSFRVRPMCMCRCCCILSLAISVPKLSECGQSECAGIAAFFSWSFLRQNCQSAPNVNALVLPHFLPGHFCAQIVTVCPI